MPTISTGKVLLSLTCLWSGAGSYLFDWNDTHIYNPTWPPHAKFHNAQTMSLGAGLAGGGLLALWGQPGPLTRGRLLTGTAAASLYWITQLSATLYPGTALMDRPRPEPDHPDQSAGSGAAPPEAPPRFRGPQSVVAITALMINAVAYLLESRSLPRRG